MIESDALAAAYSCLGIDKATGVSSSRLGWA